MNAPLSIGDRAPPVETPTLDGSVRRVPAAGQWTLLSFLRYASCPECNLRVRELKLRENELRSHDIEWLSVFHSPPRRLMRTYKAEVHAHLVADPGESLYGKYGVRRSWVGMLRGLIVPSSYWRILKAIAFGYWGGMIDRHLHSMPADFLISPDGRIVLAHYGKHIGDHIDVRVALAAVDRASISSS